MDTSRMEHTILDRLTVARLPGLGPRGRKALFAHGRLAETLAHPDAHADLLPEAARARLRTGQARRFAEAEQTGAEARGARLIGLGEPDYPLWLAQTYDPPPALYVLGRPSCRWFTSGAWFSSIHPGPTFSDFRER